MTTINNFVSYIQDKVRYACTSTNLYPSLMIAQAILESNAGKSKLSTLHYNYFGIKATPKWMGKRVAYLTSEYVKGKLVKITQEFRSYNTMEDGFADRIKFLQVNKRYAANGVFSAQSPEEQAVAFLKAGYATDPEYARKLIALIKKYNLKQYDA